MINVKKLWYAIMAEVRPQQKSFWHKTYVRVIAGGIVGVTILIGAVLGYSYYVQSRNKQAQKVLSMCLEEYVRAAGGVQDGWSTVEMSSRLGYDQYKGTVLAPYFLGLQVESLLHQNKRDEAVDITQNMMRNMSSSSPLYYLYKTKEYLINLDSSDVSTVQATVECLSKLTRDTNNQNRDCALYHIGNYYLLHDDNQLAREYWQQLVGEFPRSPWAEPVKVQLEQLI